MRGRTVAVIGAGVAGLTAALELTRFGFHVDIIEKAAFAGGHAIRFACKATDRCVSCGACIVHEKLAQAIAQPAVRILTGSRIEKISKSQSFEIKLTQKAQDSEPTPLSLAAEAVIWATGFSVFNPQNKPYGYGVFKNVITNLELEDIVRGEGRVTRPSDRRVPRSLAFIQCVGSRDAKLNHLWCSKFCCGSALRMANLIRDREPQTQVSFFYIDLQTFGRDFEAFYRQVRENVRMIRAIPGDIFQTEDGSLKVTFVNNDTHETVEERFDLVVLSAGMQPCKENRGLAAQLNLGTEDSGFVEHAAGDGKGLPGVFVAGAADGPMTIAESIASAGSAVLKTIKYLNA
ncbi:MAG: FAD-dependent oxidoreductase [Desulfobacteraceae bacterium]|jgi:heterodisulfide reductase subunit A|nr:FAD-dependent oxidoreductase [Desulfobacteraceae bacterium]